MDPFHLEGACEYDEADHQESHRDHDCDSKLVVTG